MKWWNVLLRWSRPGGGRCGMRGRWGDRHSGAMRSIEPGISRSRVWSFGPSRDDAKASLPLAAPAQQKHALLAEHVPEPPWQVQPQRAAVEIERHRALHLDVDRLAELHEILDGAEMDVRRVVPRR